MPAAATGPRAPASDSARTLANQQPDPSPQRTHTQSFRCLQVRPPVHGPQTTSSRHCSSSQQGPRRSDEQPRGRGAPSGSAVATPQRQKSSPRHPVELLDEAQRLPHARRHVKLGKSSPISSFWCNRIYRRARRPATSTESAGFALALAGRSRDKLERVRASLAQTNPAAPSYRSWSPTPPTKRPCSRSPSGRVICSTVGPTRHGLPLVAACARAGSDYRDLTGEVPFIHASIERNLSTAREGSAPLACLRLRLDSIGSGGVRTASAHGRARPRPLREARLFVHSARGLRRRDAGHHHRPVRCWSRRSQSCAA